MGGHLFLGRTINEGLGGGGQKEVFVCICACVYVSSFA